MIFILSVLALVICFYGYVFVNFQKELAGNRQRKLLGAVTIPLHIQKCLDDEPQQSSTPAAEAAHNTGNANRDSHRPEAQAVIALGRRSAQKFYQVESPYLGPLFVVPRRRGSVGRPAEAAHARLASAMYGSVPGAANHNKDINFLPIESGQGNVIQITAHVPGQS